VAVETDPPVFVIVVNNVKLSAKSGRAAQVESPFK